MSHLIWHMRSAIWSGIWDQPSDLAYEIYSHMGKQIYCGSYSIASILMEDETRDLATPPVTSWYTVITYWLHPSWGTGFKPRKGEGHKQKYFQIQFQQNLKDQEGNWPPMSSGTLASLSKFDFTAFIAGKFWRDYVLTSSKSVPPSPRHATSCLLSILYI